MRTQRCEVCRRALAMYRNDVCWPCLRSIIDERRANETAVDAVAASCEAEDGR